MFDAFGSDSAASGPLILVALGPQPDALDEHLQAETGSSQS